MADINVGLGDDLTILELTKIVCEIAGFADGITHDLSKADGTLRKLMSAGKIRTLGWAQKVALSDGLTSTCRWYFENGGN